MRSLAMASILILGFLIPAALAGREGLPPGVKNTQNPSDRPPSPEEAVRLFRPMPGFNITLFAGEPHVAQPIAMDFDDRGRVWVAECYSYPNWNSAARDRIVILEDTDGDGRFDRRKVFWDRASNLSSILIGHGGVWALCAPNLLFIPDRDGDGVADGDPVVVLDGWSLKTAHNIVNGLLWGPDGWMYGRHGILADSIVGAPGMPTERRTRLNCAIWRYHPIKRTFEVVAHGTTNPWGMDFDDHGEAFFTNCVIGHLWHMIPGAHYQRMYGQDFNPFTYELLEATSDHLHWGGGHWTTSRGGQGVHSAAGGGHAHSGGMIYLGDNWPDAFRNRVLMCNLHGNRLNRDRLERHGVGYVGKHEADVLLSDNPWFRGIMLTYGPDGGVYVTDWCDLGECHDNDGVHRSSGRIYKVFYGKPAPAIALDLSGKTDAELVQLQLHKNDWYVRHARRILSERAAAGRPMANVHEALRRIFKAHPDPARRLRAMWALYTTGGAPASWLRQQLDDSDEYVRSWAVRLLCDDGVPDGDVCRRFAGMAERETSGLVRLYLAAMLQRFPLAQRFAIALPLAGRSEDALDHVQPLMIWYGIEPAVLREPDRARQLLQQSRMPKIRQFVARRLTEGDGDKAQELGRLVAMLRETAAAPIQRDILMGMRDGLKGRKTVRMPPGWKEAYAGLVASRTDEIRQSAHLLGLQFGDSQARDLLRSILSSKSAPAAERAFALRALTMHAEPDLLPVVLNLLGEPALRSVALRVLAAYPDERIPDAILAVYPALTAEQKQAAIGTLSSRAGHALALLDAVGNKRIPRSDISPFAARQMYDLSDPRVQEKLITIWGQVRTTPSAKKALIAKYKSLLTAEVLQQAKPGNGRLVFKRTCQQCHVLFGEGNKIGPDLTGSNRSDLHYLLENIIDPSAVIGRDYQLTNMITRNGRLIAGIILEETERAVTVQTATEKLVLPKSDIEERRLAPISMMPEGQIEQLSFAELRDLIGYLRSKEQVPLPR
jgi:putative membrane-bound dehydrogenase-like protein